MGRFITANVLRPFYKDTRTNKVTTGEFALQFETDSLLFDGMDGCVIGRTLENHPVYSYEKLLYHLMDGGIENIDQADEYLMFNLQGLKGNGVFYIMQPLEG